MKNKKSKASLGKKRRKKKSNKLSVIIIPILILCAVAVVVLYLTGAFSSGDSEPVVSSNTAVAYIDYSDSSDSKMTINTEGRVLETLAEAPQELPKLSGLEFTRITTGELLEHEDPDAFDYAMRVVNALRKFDIQVSEISINSDKEAEAYVNNIKILFGTDDGKIELKVSDLNDFFDQVKDLKGTLHMEEVNDKVGYTFKQEKETKAEIRPADEETTTAGDDEEETSTEEVYIEENADQDEWQEPVYEEQYYEEQWQEPVYEEQYYEEQWQEPVYEEQYYQENVEWQPEQAW